MSARKFKGKWFYRKWATNHLGKKERIFGTPSVNTRAAAEAAERAHITRFLLEPTEAPAEREVTTLAAFIEDRWWPKIAATGNARMTVREKEIHVRLHILPRLGELALEDVRGEAVDGWLAWLATADKVKTALSPKSIRNVRATLRKILVKAVEWGALDALPALPKVKVPEAPIDWLTTEESARVLTHARSPEERCLLLFALRTGARAGEQRALEWGDLDLVTGKVTIRRSIACNDTQVKAPKSGRGRNVPLASDLLDALKSMRGLQHLQGGLVFRRPDGERWTLFQLHERLWGACRRAGVREVRWHDMRHSFASQLVSAGVPLRQVQEWMGHSSIQMTMRYSHLAPGQGGAINVLCAPQAREERKAAV